MRREESLYKMLILSIFLHLFFLFALSIPFKKQIKKIDIPFSYSVNLVGSVGDVGVAEKKGERKVALGPEKAKKTLERKKVAKKEEGRSLSRKKMDYLSTTKEELSSLEQKIRELKAKTTPYLDVGRTDKGSVYKTVDKIGSGAFDASGGGLSTLDPSTQIYLNEIWTKIKKAWTLPFGLSGSKNLEIIVIVKIRRDGRIVDMEVEKRSGNRIYDESALRTIRSVDPFPPFPSSLKSDYLEIGLRFLPGDVF